MARTAGQRPLDKLFLRLVSWSITHHRLSEASLQRQELVEALRVARRVLQESLPKSKLCSNGWEISGCLRPALHLGGDLYSYAGVDLNLRFVLADAVGHGLDSAVLVTECRALWRASAAYEQDFSAEISRLSALLYENTGPERYVAATFGRCHADGGVELILCGQSPQFVFRASPAQRASRSPDCAENCPTKSPRESKQLRCERPLEIGAILASQVEMLGNPDLPLGLFPNQQFQVQQVRLEPGDSLLLVSDGLLERRNRPGDTFGEHRVKDALRSPPGCSQRILDALLAALDRFSEGVETTLDDICALALVRSDTVVGKK